jgi:hypothetical protein
MFTHCNHSTAPTALHCRLAVWSYKTCLSCLLLQRASVAKEPSLCSSTRPITRNTNITSVNSHDTLRKRGEGRDAGTAAGRQTGRWPQLLYVTCSLALLVCEDEGEGEGEARGDLSACASSAISLSAPAPPASLALFLAEAFCEVAESVLEACWGEGVLAAKGLGTT